MNVAHLAKEAERLKNDPILAQVLNEIRTHALEELSRADADNKTAILRLQQMAQVVDEIRTMFDRFMLNGTVRDEAGPYA